MKRAARVDGNQLQIIGALTEAGAVVTSLAAVGKGVPDLLVSYRGKWSLLEVKDGSRPPSERKLTEPQKRWQDKQRAATYVVTSPMEALEAIAAASRDGYRVAMREDA